MIEIIDLVMLGLVTSLSSLIGLIIALKYLENKGFFTELLQNLFLDLVNNADMQKNIFQIAGLIGNGLKSGLGFTGTGANPKNFKQLGLQLLSDWAKGKLDLSKLFNPSPSPSQTSPSPDQKVLKAKELSNTW